MSGGAVAVAVLGMALGVGITGCMAREIRRRRAAAEPDEIMPMGATRPVEAGLAVHPRRVDCRGVRAGLPGPDRLPEPAGALGRLLAVG